MTAPYPYDARFSVQGLPYRRSLAELASSVFVLCLDPTQRRCLLTWCYQAEPDAEWSACWADEDGRLKYLHIRRVA
jgi:hypothetical protein